MRSLSVSEFAEFCKKKNPSWYIYATQNQPGGDMDRIQMTLRFPSVIISLKPDRICFQNERDQLCVEGVKSVSLYDERPCVGTVFKIHCKEGGAERSTTWLMD